MKDLIKEYGLRFAIGILIFVFLLVVKICLVPIMSWSVFWLALIYLISLGVSAITCYFGDVHYIYKNTNNDFWGDTIKIHEPRIHEYQATNQTELFPEHHTVFLHCTKVDKHHVYTDYHDKKKKYPTDK